MPTNNDPNNSDRTLKTTSIRDTTQAAFDALGDLQVVESALRAAIDENDPFDDETKQVVLSYAIELMHDRLAELDRALESLNELTPR